MPIRCEIISQDIIVCQGEADMVVVPGIDGETGILLNHAPILSVFGYSMISVRQSQRKKLLYCFRWRG